MISYSSERDVPAKQEEGNSTSNNGKLTKASSSSRQWSGLKDPRVVRVSRAFGGKDRHSKVCTIRGLRDRRVRLSVPTAIQLYDLQDRLGLNQPSKVVDWLLNAAKDEIDELPPLPATFIGQFPQSIVVSHEVMNGQQSSFASLVGINNMSFEKHQGLQSSPSPSNKGGLNINENALLKENQATAPKSAYWNLNAPSASNCKEVAWETITKRSSWMKRNHDQREDQEAVKVHKASNSSIPSLLDNVVPYNSYYQYWDPASLSLSHLGSYGSHCIQPDQDPHNYNVVPVPSPLVSLPPPASQLLLCPSVPPPSFFPPNYLANHAAESNTKQINHSPMMMSSSSQNFLANSMAPSLYSISQPVRPLQLNLNPRAFHSQSNNTSQ